MRGVVAAGRANELMERLDAGGALRTVILGASVAVNGGCIAQPGDQCMKWNGQKEVSMPPWQPRPQRFKGAFVRFFEWFNASWPHAQHELLNHAIAATNVNSWLPCLFAHLPPHVDLVVLELGSMAHWQRLDAIEKLVRILRSLDPPPALLFLTVTFWSDLRPSSPWSAAKCAVINGTRMSNRMDGALRRQSGALHPRETWPAVERHLAKICRHYGEGCVSMRHALAPSAHRGLPGFALSDIAADCLHPATGTRGTEYMTDLLIGWLDFAAARRRDAAAPGIVVGSRVRMRARSGSAATLMSSSLPPPPPRSIRMLMPPPLDPKLSTAMGGKSGCYGFGKLRPQMVAGTTRSAAGASALQLSWHTAGCPTNVTGGGGGACAAHDEVRPCPYANGTDTRQPGVWHYCYSSLGTQNRQVKPGLVAFVPGATLYFTLRPGFLRGSAAPQRVAIGLVHLQSYDHMGVAAVRCVAGCACDEQRIDAHQRDGQRASVFVTHDFEATMTTHCSLEVRVLEETNSGEHKFKIAKAVVNEVSP